MLLFGVTLFAAFIIGTVLQKQKLPGGMLLGSVIAACLLSVIFHAAYVPFAGKILAQCLAGAFIGCSVKKEDLGGILTLGKPAAILLGVHLVLNLTVGGLIYLLSPLDAVTALMCSVPGGLSDIPLIAADMGADVPKVFAMQFARMLIEISVFPFLIDRITGRETDTVVPVDSQKRPVTLLETLPTLLVATFSGIVGHMLDIPAGTLLFALLGTIFFNLLTGKAKMHIAEKRLAQLLSGAYIGSTIQYQDLLELRMLGLPLLLLIIGYSISCFVIGYLLSRHCGMSRRKAMLSGIPAGASDMALIASDMGIQSTDLVLLQVIRLVVVVTVFPQVIAIVLKIMTK